MVPIKISARHYYDFEPPAKHGTGDIWMDMPSQGLLRRSTCTALVITPACDLANQKVETITYLPVLPVREWFLASAFWGEARRTLIDLLKQLSMEKFDDQLPRVRLPEPSQVVQLRKCLAKRQESEKSKKLKECINRCIAGTDHIEAMLQSSVDEADMKKLKAFMGRTCDRICDRIVRNGYTTDIHFLPADGQDRDWSSVPIHSLVLFRYPITVPAEILDLAQDISIVDWSKAIGKMAQSLPCARNFSGKRPMKTLRLKADFLNDLLTRYVSLYVRLGSPDFSGDTISRFSNEIRGNE